jgi:hypothetical protein
MCGNRVVDGESNNIRGEEEQSVKQVSYGYGIVVKNNQTKYSSEIKGNRCEVILLESTTINR